MSKKKESKQKKINVRVDFTPMVDMLMLLITFFMLCTTLSKPQTMELTLPSNDENANEENKNESKASQTVTLYLAAKDKIYYGEGIPEYNNPQWLKDATWGGGDTGIRNVHMNFRQYEPTHLMENTIYNELIRRGYAVDVGVATVETAHANVREKRQHQ